MRKISFLLLVFSPFLFAEEDLFSALDSSLPVSEELSPTDSETEFKDSTILSTDPDVQIRDFYRRRRPVNEVKVPEPKGERLMWKLGETMRDVDIPIGEYSVIRVKDRSKGYHVRYVGRVSSDGKHVKVIEATNEILPGDHIVKESFSALSLPPVSGDGGAVERGTASLGEAIAFLEPNQDETMLFSGTKQLVGAIFKEYKGGNSVSVGAVLSIKRDGEEIAKAVVVDADLDLATLYVFKSDKEVRAEDEVFSQ